MSSSELPQLSAIELRVLGSLIEKSKTTPEYYPMSVNALTAACNQKSSRFPVTAYTEDEVMQALQSLKGLSLVATAVGGGSRTVKYKHNFGTVYDVTDAAIAVLCLLMLRGPLTAGEINSTSGRLHTFADIASVHETLDALRKGTPVFVKELARKSGQKENRFSHLLGDTSEAEHEDTALAPANPASSALEERVTKLEEELAQLKSVLKDLL